MRNCRVTGVQHLAEELKACPQPPCSDVAAQRDAVSALEREVGHMRTELNRLKEKVQWLAERHWEG